MEIKKKPKKPTTSKLKAKLDAIFSRYIRLTYADEHGYCTCYTCDKRLHWTKIQNGHLFSRGRYATRFDPDNCRPQCAGCNVMGKGNYQEYFPRMIEEVGAEAVMNLQGASKHVVKFNSSFYEDEIKHYEAEVKRLIQEKGASE